MRTRPVRSICLAILFVLGWGAVPRTVAEPTPAEAEFFEKEVRPLLVERCLKCHGDNQPKGGLKLTARAHLLRGGDTGPAAVPGKPEDSLLVRAVRYQDEPRMPPKGKLTDRQIDLLTRWIKMGVPWPESSGTTIQGDGRFEITEAQRRFWSFQPVRTVAVPTVRDTTWSRSDVDRFLLAALEAKGLTPAAPADKRTLLRRATFDLTGLPPTPDEIEAFLKDDSPQAFPRVVDRLLASPQYGERWGRHWLDVVRYADVRDLIQLPPPSDFREIWRYRDWVVSAFNRDLPYPDFIRHQVAGDLLPPPKPGGINKDGLVATGMLALADFVPGDVDKDLMIADYVNDEIDAVGKAFLGLSISCARCHDHKFDPISTEDYYALAGIFFSTRLIPGPVPGNTPLVRVPLASPADLAQDAADKRRRAELESLLPEAANREYLALVRPLVAEQTVRYLTAATEYRRRVTAPEKPTLADVAKQQKLNAALLAGWVDYLGRVEKQPQVARPAALRDAAAGKLTGPALERAAADLQQALVALAKKQESEPPEKRAASQLARAALVGLRADDPDLRTDSAGRVTIWPNRANALADGKPPAADGPVKVEVQINEHPKTVLRYDGSALLEVPGHAPPAGTLFAVYRSAANARGGERLVGWEDSSVGRHGLGVMLDPGGRMHAILRNNGQSGDLTDTRKADGAASLEVVCLTWGGLGTTLHRNATAAGANKGITGISSDPEIRSLRVGGPGSGSSPRFTGDLAEVRVYNRQLSDAERLQVEAELRDTWFKKGAPDVQRADPLAALQEELLSPRGPFWPALDVRLELLPSEARARLAGLRQELETLKKKPPLEGGEAVVVQEGGPKGTRHEGFKDAHVFLRGDHKKLGKVVPRGFPRILTGERRELITTGSGRLQLADWLARPDNPLTARVMVNRVWLHHFGEGLVRTPNDFGARGDRPTHPDLLDYLAGRFVASGWSVKALHRLIMLASAYQQSSRPSAASLAADPDNRLIGHMNRRRLEAEAIRDSLLAVAGRLDLNHAGPAFADPTTPRRTLYLQSARTGANTSDFARLFDRADPGASVGQRGQTVVAPQALFFLNDPQVADLSRALAGCVAREAPDGRPARIRHLYALVLGRRPSKAEVELGERLLAASGDASTWERYCHLILCTNEFVYLD
jgi:hypothetical protein